MDLLVQTIWRLAYQPSAIAVRTAPLSVTAYGAAAIAFNATTKKNHKSVPKRSRAENNLKLT